MKSYALFQEYIWLVNTIHKAGKITLDEINRRWLDTELSEGVGLARSTFNRHRDAILDMFGIIIECDKRDGFKYYIDNEEVLEENTIQNWMLSTLSVNNVLAESKGVHNRIILEPIPSDGENLHKFIEAMKRSVKIELYYRRYGADSPKSSMKVEPIFVKLFNRRWYAMVKFPTPGAWIFTLAFDRILSLELTEEKFEYCKDFDPVAFYEESYGIVWDDKVPLEKVRIRAFGREANYLRDLPLHHSQREVEVTDDYSDFEIMLRPTSDFYAPLLSRGSAIKIMEPQWLADEIKKAHEAALDLYK